MQNHSHPQTSSHSKSLLFSESLLVVHNKCNFTSTKYTLLKINTTTSIYTFLATAFGLIWEANETTRARVPPGYPLKHSKTINKSVTTRFYHFAWVLLLNTLHNPSRLEIEERKQLFKCTK